jgi:hypothetical protein
MMSDSQFLIGKLIDGPGDPDAIHVATLPATAAEILKPGQHVGFEEGGWRVTASPKAPYTLIGIVDPFLTADIPAGKRFFVLLYPNTITGLRHVWSHPSITKNGLGVGSSSEKWLRDFAFDVDADYHEMMDVASSHCGADEEKRWSASYLIEGGKWEGQNTPDEFWIHFKNVTGKKPQSVWKDDRGNERFPGIFSCSC